METAQDGPLTLVVDDDPVSRLVVKAVLEEVNCRGVLEADDGLAAQKLLQAHTDIDLVVTDILMPGLDGIELLRWAREHSPGPVWVILSGLDTFDAAVDAIRLGAFDFLAKPPRHEQLKVAVRNALEWRRLHQERNALYAELEETNRQLLAKVRELEAKSELLRRDLQRAEVIQRALLPKTPPLIEHYCVQAVYRPGKYVGGDLYDVVRLDDHHVALYLADATGHGVTAAMLSVLYKERLMLVDEQSGRPLSPAAVLDGVNRSLGEAVIAPGLFLTAVYCLLNTAENTVTLASAGAPPVLHVKAGGEVRQIKRTGPALGLTTDARFEEQHFQLAAGDRLLFYTDGLLHCGTKPEWDPVQHILSLRATGAGDLLAELLAETQASPNGDDRDDVTLLLLDAQDGFSRFDNESADHDVRPAPRRVAVPRAGVVFYGEGEEANYFAIRGRMIWTHCDAFYETACEILQAGRLMVLDLTECEYLDSTALGTIHELVGRGDVRLQGVKPHIRAMFEELSMDRVLERIHEPVSIPELYPLVMPSGDAAAGPLRILRAHETLAALSARNREKFQEIVEALSRDLGNS